MIFSLFSVPLACSQKIENTICSWKQHDSTTPNLNTPNLILTGTVNRSAVYTNYLHFCTKTYFSLFWYAVFHKPTGQPGSKFCKYTSAFLPILYIASCFYALGVRKYVALTRDTKVVGITYSWWWVPEGKIKTSLVSHKHYEWSKSVIARFRVFLSQPILWPQYSFPSLSTHILPKACVTLSKIVH